MIQANDLRFSVAGGTEILKGISFAAQAGELIVLAGPNGAGKSTLLSLLAGGIQPTSGEVLLDQVAYAAWNPKLLAQRRAVMAQHYALTVNFTVYELVMMGRYPHFKGRPRPLDHAAVSHALDLAGVSHLVDRKILTLSGGEQQLVHLSRALAQIWNPAPERKGLILLDEPVSSLDIQFQHRLLGIACSLADAGHCVIMVLHDLNLAAAYAHRLVLLGNGVLLADAKPHEALEEELLSALYEIPVQVVVLNGSPWVVPIAQAFAYQDIGDHSLVSFHSNIS